MKLAATLSAAGRMDFAAYQPQPVVDAANALWPMGREGALAALDLHLAWRDLQTDPQEGLLLVLRALFDVPVPPGHHPPLRLGGTVPPPPADLRALPHFPLVLIDDWPLLLVSGVTLGGDVEPVTVLLQHYRVTGTLRAQPLSPAQPPQRVLQQFRTLYTRAYGAPPKHAVLAHVTRQLGGG